jgi:hypothetical protein
MKLHNQAKVGLATVICLLCQGYAFTYILGVEPHTLVSIAPLFLYMAYLYARSRRKYYFNKPLYWIGGIVVLTIILVLPYALKLEGLP